MPGRCPRDRFWRGRAAAAGMCRTAAATAATHPPVSCTRGSTTVCCFRLARDNYARQGFVRGCVTVARKGARWRGRPTPDWNSRVRRRLRTDPALAAAAGPRGLRCWGRRPGMSSVASRGPECGQGNRSVDPRAWLAGCRGGEASTQTSRRRCRGARQHTSHRGAGFYGARINAKAKTEGQFRPIMNPGPIGRARGNDAD